MMMLKLRRSVFAIACVALPLMATAQAKVANPAKMYDTLENFLLAMLDIFLLVVIPIMVLMMIYGGYLIVAAGADEKKIKTGKAVVLWNLVGAAIILAARVIYFAVEGTWKLFE